jgi:hypothetical protein
MACSRHLNLNQLPIVCVNVDGYYEPFREMLNRAYEDELIKLSPEEIVHFASSAEEAIRWVEAVKCEGSGMMKPISTRQKKSLIMRSSFFSAAAYQNDRSSFSSLNGDKNGNSKDANLLWYKLGLSFVVGTAVGALIVSRGR